MFNVYPNLAYNHHTDKKICRHIYHIQNKCFYRSAQSKKRHYGPKLEDALNVNLMTSIRSLLD